MAELSVSDLRLSIGRTNILNGIAFSVERAETVGIIGPNGSGKTTLFNCISGFNFPQQGAISFRGSDLTHLEPYRRAQLGLGRVFQNFGVFKEMTVLENIQTAIESKQPWTHTFFPWSKQTKENRERALEYLDEVKLAPRARDKAGSLSGGQLRLLEIVRTLAFGAEIFLLDEPTAGVSPRMKDDVATLLAKLQQDKKTVLVIEHDINFIQKFCRRTIVLDSGRVLLDDATDKIRESEALKEIYFGKSAA